MLSTLILLLITTEDQSKKTEAVPEDVLRGARLWPEVPFDGNVRNVYWSPDGEWGAYTLEESTPAFNKDRALYEAGSLCLVSRDQKTVKRIYTAYASDVTKHNEFIYPWLDRHSKLVWSPDSKRVLFRKSWYFGGTTHSYGTPLFDIDIKNLRVRKISKDLLINGNSDDRVGYNDNVTFSRDGTKLLLVQGSGKHPSDNRKIVLLDYKTLKRTVLTQDGCASFSAKWSPDETKILYSSIAYDIPEEEKWSPHKGKEIPRLALLFCYVRVWVMNSDGSGKLRLAHDVSYADAEPRWIDDNRIQFERSILDETQASLNWKSSLWEVHPDGTGLRKVEDIRR